MALITLTILLMAAAGAALVIAGLRGKATDAHPLCRRCGFDLIGRFPWAEPSCPACPDCGQLLLQHRSVRPGTRVTRGRMMATGWMLCFPACVLGIAWAADSLAGGATAAIKPTAIMTAQLAGATRSTPTLRRLTARVSTGSTGGGDVQPVIERALLLQSDRTRPLDADWLEFIEVCRRRGHLTLQQQERYFRNAAEFLLLCRPYHRARPADPRAAGERRPALTAREAPLRPDQAR